MVISIAMLNYQRVRQDKTTFLIHFGRNFVLVEGSNVADLMLP